MLPETSPLDLFWKTLPYQPHITSGGTALLSVTRVKTLLHVVTIHSGKTVQNYFLGLFKKHAKGGLNQPYQFVVETNKRNIEELHKQGLRTMDSLRPLPRHNTTIYLSLFILKYSKPCYFYLLWSSFCTINLILFLCNWKLNYFNANGKN